MKNKILKGKTLCKFLEICLTKRNVKMQHRDINCFTNNAENNCETYKFYERYGTDYLGIGAMDAEVAKGLDKMLKEKDVK